MFDIAKIIATMLIFVFYILEFIGHSKKEKSKDGHSEHNYWMYGAIRSFVTICALGPPMYYGLALLEFLPASKAFEI